MSLHSVPVLVGLAMAISVATVSVSAKAETEPSREIAPLRIEWGTSFELQADRLLMPDDSAATPLNVYATVEQGLTLILPSDFSINSGFVLEQVNDPSPPNASIFEQQGVFVEELFIQWAPEPFAIRVGKYNPTFGRAWDVTPGVYGTEFAEDYELTERLGAAVEATLVTKSLGTHVLTGNMFFADTTALSGSAFTHRGQLSLDDGGLSNTEEPTSIAVTVDGEGLFGVEGLGYTSGYRYQDNQSGSGEHGVVIGVLYEKDIDEDITASTILEAAHFVDFDGAREVDATYATIGIGLEYMGYTASSSYSGRFIDDPVRNLNDSVAQVSIGYGFDNGLGLEAGYKFGDEAGQGSHTFGLLLAYEIGGEIPLR